MKKFFKTKKALAVVISLSLVIGMISASSVSTTVSDKTAKTVAVSEEAQNPSLVEETELAKAETWVSEAEKDVTVSKDINAESSPSVKQVAQSAETTDATPLDSKDKVASANKSVSDAEVKEEPIRTVTDGEISEYGLKNVKYVDAEGNEVDEEELYNRKDFIADSEKMSSTIGGDKTLSSKVTTKRTASASDSSYTSSATTLPIRNQGTWGLCWAFAATACVETNMLKNNLELFGQKVSASNLDFSERHMGWFAHNTRSLTKTDMMYNEGKKLNTPKKAYVGGNSHESAMYMVKGNGMELEINAPYDGTSAMKGLTETERYSATTQLVDWNNIGGYTKTTEVIESSVENIKKMLVEYGAVQVSYNSGIYGRGADGRANVFTGTTGTNHAVTIVGWDDSYDKNQFNNPEYANDGETIAEGAKPEANGAWLVRNSWGDWSSSSDSDKLGIGAGYFWMSYYESSIDGLASYKVRNADNAGRAYSYVAHPYSTGISFGNGKTAKAANVYTAQSDETLNSVGVMVGNVNLKATATIYVSDTKMTSPTDGTSKGTTTVSDLGAAGYHLIDLATPVALKKGQYFSVIIELSLPSTASSSDTVFFQVEHKNDGAEKAGQTFYYESNSWIDATDASLVWFKNAYIFAYTSDTDLTGTSKSQLDDLVSDLQASADEAMVKQIAGDSKWDAICSAINIGENVKQDNKLAWAIRTVQNQSKGGYAKNLYTTATKQYGAGSPGVQLALNGGTVKRNGIATNYKSAKLYVDMQKTGSWVLNKKKKVYEWKTRGNYVAAVTSKYEKPSLTTEGKLATTDEAATAIAAVKVKGSYVTITPKAVGSVYVWVLYYPKSDVEQANRLADQTDYAVVKVDVSEAPATVKLYNNADVDPTDTTISMYTSATVPAGGSTNVYVKATKGKKTKKVNTLEEMLPAEKDFGFYTVVTAKYADYVKVTLEDEATQKYKITVSEDILKFAKSGKTVAVTVSFICDKNGKKVNFKVVAGNPVKSITLEKASTATDSSTVTKVNDIINVALASAKTAAQSTLLTETKTTYLEDYAGTDGTKIYRLGSADGYTILPNGGVKITKAPTKAQKKISLGAVKKTTNYKVTAAKGTVEGTEVYFLIWHNSVSTDKMGAGFQLVKVTAGTAAE